MSSVQECRVEFASGAEGAIAKGDEGLSSLVADVKSKRRAKILEVRGELSEADRKAAVAMLVVLQDLAGVAKLLLEAGDGAGALWQGSLVRHGAEAVACGGVSVPMGQEASPDWQWLVVTPLSRECQRAYFRAISEKRPLVHRGPPGTGKTETVKDASRSTGREPLVLSCAAAGADFLGSLEKLSADGAVKDEFTPLIFDEFDKLSPEQQQAAAKFVKDKGWFSAFCCGAGFELPADLGDAVVVEMAVPPFELIAENMLAAEGFAECEELGSACTALLRGCQEGLSKQCHYDFGMRKLKHVAKSAGLEGRGSGFADERAALAAACLTSIGAACTSADRAAFSALMSEHLGTAPGEGAGAADRIARAAASMETVLAGRHGCMFVNVGGGDADACIAALGGGAALFAVEGSMEALGPEELYGADGAFTKALREAAGHGGASRVVLHCGGGATAAKFEPLFTLLDDNRKLVLAGGEAISLPPSVRVIFTAKDCAQMSPAAVSRLGIVMVD